MLRFPGAVTHFSPGSHASRPLQTTSIQNIFMAGDPWRCMLALPCRRAIEAGWWTPACSLGTASCTQACSLETALVHAGDWVKGVPHGANGLSQERAYVTGLRAATLVTEQLHTGRPATILDVEPDEPHMVFGKQVAGGFRRALERTGLPSLFL